MVSSRGAKGPINRRSQSLTRQELARIMACSNPRVRRLAWRMGRALYCAARGDNLGYDIASNGEATLQQTIADMAPRGSVWTVLDVGANQGQWAASMIAAAARAGTDSGLTIVSVEPVPGTARMLQRAIDAHQSSTVWLLEEVAFSSRPKEVIIHVVEDGAGTNSVYSPNGPDVECESAVTVAATTVDRYCQQSGLGVLAMIKIDVEGHDFEVLLGARETLADGKVDCIQFEYNHRWISAGRSLRDVFDLIRGTSYRLARVVPGGLELIPSWNSELDRYFEANYALVGHEVVSRIGRPVSWTRWSTLE